MTRQEQIAKAAAVAVEQCLAVEAGETVLIVCDEPCRDVGYALWRAAADVGAEVQIIEMLPREENGAEPPASVAAAMRVADVVFAPASKSLTHTDARRAASAAGARIATLPGITEEIMSRALMADHEEIARLTGRIAAWLRGRERVRITSPAGTDVSFSIAGREVHEDVGLVREPGEVTNLPAGEAYVAPVEGTAQGIVAFDGSIAESGVLDEPIIVRIVDGNATEISGAPYAPELAAAMDRVGPEARNVAELGIGTNPAAKLSGSTLEDEKILGTVHIAFGDNQSMGGAVSAPYHQDGILLKPTVLVDDELLMKDGELIL